jgi:hypothetical protein
MQEDSGSVVPAQVEELPTEAAELRIFLIPASRKGKRGRVSRLGTGHSPVLLLLKEFFGAAWHD